MDYEWSIERLEEWVELAESARSSSWSSTSRRTETYSFGSLSNAKVTQLRAHHDQVRRIVHKALGLKQLPDLLRRSGSRDYVELVDGIVLCQEALGRLRTGRETRVRLGTSAPTMAADQLHPEVWQAASKRWSAGNYSDAVQRAATFLNATIQATLDRHDVSDSSLMAEAFSLAAPGPGKPRLRWPGADDNLSVKAMRVGMLNYGQGLFSAIRNIATHSVEELPQQIALEQLAALSVLARWVDGCEVIRAD